MSSVLNCVACALALTVSEAPLGHASDTTLVSEGARVKVLPASGATAPVIGTVVDLAPDTLVVLTELHEVLAYHSSDLSKVEVSEGEKRKTFLGLGVGFAVGLGAGFVICNADKDANTCGSDADLLGDMTAAVVLLTAAVSAGIGAAVGALIKTERWQEAQYPRQPLVALNLGKDGSVRLAFSLRL
jgi:hypothetical protein